MPDEEIIVVEEPAEPKQPRCYTLLQYLLFKIDRTIAICGLITIAIVCLWLGKALPESGAKIVALVVNSLGFYLGVRLGSK